MRRVVGFTLLAIAAILPPVWVGATAYFEHAERGSGRDSALAASMHSGQAHTDPRDIAGLDGASVGRTFPVVIPPPLTDVLAGEDDAHAPSSVASGPLGPPTSAPESGSIPDPGADPGLVSGVAALTPGRPVRLQIPRIALDQPVGAVEVQDGRYQVPAWHVGYHVDSSLPGAPGNSVFNGHLQTMNGRGVLARLREVQAGDRVRVYTDRHRFDWVVEDVRTVPKTEDRFIDPTPDTRITIYTCAGSYLPLARDYSDRLVVVGRPEQRVPAES
jgi:LPXTG-site transpeptidase (sortase) family protein